MNRITQFVADLGTNAEWIAANAHCWFAAFLVLLCRGNYFVAIGCLIAAAIKEFWFDARYEVPKQTALDNWSDFLEYAIGIVIGYGASLL